MKKAAFFLFLLIACSSKNMRSVVGFYKSKEFNFFQRTIKAFENEPYVTGSKLTLNQDSSYIHKTCGNTIIGTWKVSGDILLLKAITNKFNNDSLQKLGLNGKQPKVGTEQDSVKIKGNTLIFKLKFRGVDNIIYEVMEKE
jgi:hypothetical protein